MNWSNGWKLSAAVLVAAAAALVAVPNGAEAFCGAYVSGGQKDLFNNATHVAMMRHEQTTVLSMQNNYEGPPEDFAMIVPTPVVLKEENVKTLEDEVFSKIDKLSAPRLVEYWEQDPCYEEPEYDRSPGVFDAAAAAGAGDAGSAADTGSGYVKVEEKFTKGEYNIVILSSNDSSALESWLKENGYNIPDGAGPYLKPYIQQGSKFFVAKVDTEKVEFTDDGEAVLSPLRFHYESEEFKLPVRLGLINSKGKQDLIVNILAKNQRYDVANYPSAKIPTNIEVVANVKNYFPTFYRALFKETLKKHRKDGQNPVVTEYAWGAKKCDPCPFGMALQDDSILTLGGDVLADKYDDVGHQRDYYRPGDAGQQTVTTFGYGWVVTRLHTRYGADEIGKDLVFEKAEAIKGGRGGATNLSHKAEPADTNNFQGRYIIKHAWDGAVTCDNPDRGNWGGRHGGSPGVQSSPGETTQKKEGTDDQDAPEEVDLEDQVKEDVDPLGVKTNVSDEDDGIQWEGTGTDNGGAGTDTPAGDGNGETRQACSQSGGSPVAPVFGLLAIFGVIALRRSREDG